MNAFHSALGKPVVLALSAVTAMAVAACGGAGPSADAVYTPAQVTVAPSSAALSTSASTTVSPTPATPTPISTVIPADVPTTGPNITKAGEAPPVMPLAATTHSVAGGLAFATFFIQTIDWGYATTSSTYMRHYFRPSCVSCASAADALDHANRNHWHFIGNQFLSPTSKGVPVDDGRIADFSARVTFNLTAGESLDQAGKPQGAEPPHPGFVEQLYLSWSISGWIVTDMVERA
jgi:hypothetical protein